VSTDLLILWHMHQPRYVHPITGKPLLPWVRLHAASGYLDMARALERRPGVHVTVNFVPALLEQIEGMLAGTRDALEELADKPTADLTEPERRLVLARSFSVRRDRVIMVRPRYAELLAKRGEDGRPAALAETARRFTTADLRDLQCLFLLAWLGFAAREDHHEIDALDAKGRGFTEDDKRTLLLVQRQAAAAVLPAWRRLAERGQVELCASPFYHPIVPLLVDSDVARRSRPNDRLPPRFAFPDDAREQIRLAQSTHQAVFGAPPRGMWPPEGSLSPEAVAIYGECGVAWLGGDEETLARALALSPGMQAAAAPVAGRPTARSRVWRHEGVDLVFRDRDLSDRIGFRYAHVAAQAAAADLLGAVRAAGGDGVLGLFLDGENAWEAYPRRGADFLDALYARLEEEAAAGRMRARTVSEALADHGSVSLPRLHSGSWIEASFKIWIGDPVKNRGWNLLLKARERLARAARDGTADARALAAARRLLLAAEGSDWFWWYGEPFSSIEDPIFDELFRAHLEAAWRALGEEPPPEVIEPLGTRGGGQPVLPTAHIHPLIDGKADRFYEWHGAATFDVGRGTAMADSGHPVDRVLVGFDDHNLYLRIDPTRPERRRITAARMVLRLRVADREEVLHILTGAADGGAELAARKGKIGSLDVVELSLPLAEIGARPRDELRVWMTLEFADVPFARVPRDGAIVVQIPWPGWEEENWSA
jgi:alpha-amylase/alpha-mannosidase (GH57 family)